MIPLEKAPVPPKNPQEINHKIGSESRFARASTDIPFFRDCATPGAERDTHSLHDPRPGRKWASQSVWHCRPALARAFSAGTGATCSKRKIGARAARLHAQSVGAYRCCYGDCYNTVSVGPGAWSRPLCIRPARGPALARDSQVTDAGEAWLAGSCNTARQRRSSEPDAWSLRRPSRGCSLGFPVPHASHGIRRSNHQPGRAPMRGAANARNACCYRLRPFRLCELRGDNRQTASNEDLTKQSQPAAHAVCGSGVSCFGSRESASRAHWPRQDW